MSFSHTWSQHLEMQGGGGDSYKKSEKLRTVPIDKEFTIWFIIFLS